MSEFKDPSLFQPWSYSLQPALVKLMPLAALTIISHLKPAQGLTLTHSDVVKFDPKLSGCGGPGKLDSYGKHIIKKNIYILETV